MLSSVSFHYHYHHIWVGGGVAVKKKKKKKELTSSSKTLLPTLLPTPPTPSSPLNPALAALLGNLITLLPSLLTTKLGTTNFSSSGVERGRSRRAKGDERRGFLPSLLGRFSIAWSKTFNSYYRASASTWRREREETNLVGCFITTNTINTLLTSNSSNFPEFFYTFEKILEKGVGKINPFSVGY